MQDALWLIRWEDGDLRSYFGTEKEATQYAEEHKEEHGGNYKIL